MVKLIMTDIDGTLTAEGNPDLNPEYFEVIRALAAHGVTVAVASGRHGTSLKQLFAPVRDCIRFVSQNGCVIEGNGKIQVPEPIPTEWIRAFWHDLSLHDDCDSILDTATETFCPRAGTPMHRLVVDDYHFNITATGGWDRVPDETFSMMTVWHADGSWDFLQRAGIYDKWKDRICMVSTGKIWVDCMMPSNNKGRALKTLTSELGLRKEETISFGDNYNDIPMLQAAGIGYAVDNACADVQAAADRVIPGWRQNGVLQVWKQVLADIEYTQTSRQSGI